MLHKDETICILTRFVNRVRCPHFIIIYENWINKNRTFIDRNNRHNCETYIILLAE